jgi:cytochrome b
MHPLWDIPTRIFHWLLVLAVFTSWLSHELEWIGVHLWSGYTVLVLVCFRLLWGLLGSLHSRFANFVRSPATVLGYIRGEEYQQPGHNPLGGWAVLVLLILLLLQALTGLFNSDGLLFDGPLYHALDSNWSDKLGAWHERVFWLLLAMIALHLLAVSWYQLYRRRNLLLPMFTGGDNGSTAPVSLWRALLLLLSCCGLLALVVYLAPQPALPWL